MPIRLDDEFEVRIRFAVLKFPQGTKFVRSWSLVGGISATMRAFEILLPDGGTRKLIARQPSQYRFGIDRNAAAQEYAILEAVTSAGIKAPQPVFLEEATEKTPYPLFIVEYIDGDTELNPADKSGYVKRYAEMLAKIHCLDVNLPGLRDLPRQVITNKIPRRNLNDLLREREIITCLSEIDQVPDTNAIHVCHGDFWPGNVLWHENEICGVIDWEEVNLGNPIADLSVSRLDLLWALGWEAMTEFTDSYRALMPLDYSSLAYFDLQASLRPMMNIGEWAKSLRDLGRTDISTGTMVRDHQAFVADALSRF